MGEGWMGEGWMSEGWMGEGWMSEVVPGMDGRFFNGWCGRLGLLLLLLLWLLVVAKKGLLSL